MTSKQSFRQSLMAGLYSGSAAAIINAILFLIFHALGIITDNILPQPNQPMTVAAVIMASMVASLIASIIFYLIEKISNNGFKIFRILSIVLVLMSFYAPFTVIPGATTGYSLSLCLMHLVVASSLIYFIGRSVNKHKTNEIK
jgi:CDP-diglyceride synthetase